MIVVKADVRIDNMIETIRKYVEGFIDSDNMEEISCQDRTQNREKKRFALRKKVIIAPPIS